MLCTAGRRVRSYVRLRQQVSDDTLSHLEIRLPSSRRSPKNILGKQRQEEQQQQQQQQQQQEEQSRGLAGKQAMEPPCYWWCVLSSLVRVRPSRAGEAWRSAGGRSWRGCCRGCALCGSALKIRGLYNRFCKRFFAAVVVRTTAQVDSRAVVTFGRQYNVWESQPLYCTLLMESL